MESRKKHKSDAVVNIIYVPVHLVTLCIMSPVYLVRGMWRIARTGRARKVDEMTGYEYEEYVAQRLKKEGYRHVTLTQAASDYGIDILATDRQGRRVGAQCKKYLGPVGVKAVQEAYSGAEYYGCERALVVTSSSFTPAARRLALEIGVELLEGYV